MLFASLRLDKLTIVTSFLTSIACYFNWVLLVGWGRWSNSRVRIVQGRQRALCVGRYLSDSCEALHHFIRRRHPRGGHWVFFFQSAVWLFNRPLGLQTAFISALLSWLVHNCLFGKRLSKCIQLWVLVWYPRSFWKRIVSCRDHPWLQLRNITECFLSILIRKLSLLRSIRPDRSSCAAPPYFIQEWIIRLSLLRVLLDNVFSNFTWGFNLGGLISSLCRAHRTCIRYLCIGLRLSHLVHDILNRMAFWRSVIHSLRRL